MRRLAGWLDGAGVVLAGVWRRSRARERGGGTGGGGVLSAMGTMLALAGRSEERAPDTRLPIVMRCPSPVAAAVNFE